QNCSLTNVTVASLTVQCSSTSASARHSEQYHLEIYNDANELVRNVSSAGKSAHFQVTDLPPGFSFNLFVYATNKNGHSEKVQINANTLVGEPRKLGRWARRKAPLAVSNVHLAIVPRHGLIPFAEHIEHKINVK